MNDKEKHISSGVEFIAGKSDFKSSSEITYMEGPQAKICGLVISNKVVEVSYSDGSTRDYNLKTLLGIK